MIDVPEALAGARTAIDQVQAAVDERSITHAEAMAALQRSLDTTRSTLATTIAEKETAQRERDTIAGEFTAHLALPAPAGHTTIEPPPPPPARKRFTRRLYLLQQGPISASDLAAGHRNVPSAEGFSTRQTMTDTVANPRLWAQELAKGKAAGFELLAARLVTGWKMPVNLMGRTLTVGSTAQAGQGKPFPSPMMADGSPNDLFITNLYGQMQKAAQALLEAATEEFPVLHWPWYAQQWAEVYYGPEVQALVRALGGEGRQFFIDSHNAIIDAARVLQDEFPQLIMGFQLSGHGPIADMVDDWSRHIAEVFEPERAMIHANGLSYRGQWGQASDATDTQMDAAFDIAAADVPGLAGFDTLLAGLQAIQDFGTPGNAAYTVSQMRDLWGQVRSAQGDSVELYTHTFTVDNSSRDALSTLEAEAARWLSEGATT